jgi:hypothetical protein
MYNIFLKNNKYREFKEDKFDGKGEFKWPNGIKYKGEWSNGEMNGEGVLTTEKGEVFRGTWKNGQTVAITKDGETSPNTSSSPLT